MRVIVTGGRNYQDRDHVFKVLSTIHNRTPIAVLVHGGATGADSLADLWAKANGVARESHVVTKEDWNRLGRRAGPLRNQKMAELGADLLVPFPGGSGTADMIRQAKANGIKVYKEVELDLFGEQDNAGV